MSEREKYLSAAVISSIESAKEKGYNNPELADIEDSMRDVVRKLRPNIDAGIYDTLVSDDVGGRMPTLILRHIMKERSPEDLETYFVPAGKTLTGRKSGEKSVATDPQQAMLAEELGKIHPKKKVLIVTQLSHSGETLKELRHLLHDAGVAEDDIHAAVLSGFEKDAEDMFTGDHTSGMLGEMHAPVSGVSKVESDDGTTRLVRRSTYLKDRGLDGEVTDDYRLWEQYINFFGLRDRWRGSLGADKSRKKETNPVKARKYEQKLKRPLTGEQMAEMNKRVASAREDVKTMADRLSNEIWNEAQEIEAA